ncbi:MAG TPA: hypothetical protein VGR91_16465 [Stellaceae bacterium]|nr:hypothetical protein [Stellaceae bacterium]
MSEAEKLTGTIVAAAIFASAEFMKLWGFTESEIRRELDELCGYVGLPRKLEPARVPPALPLAAYREMTR